MSSAISREAIEAAHARIGDFVRKTPVLELPRGELSDRARVCLKLELLQRTGSFKPRGAFNNVLQREVPAAGIAAASGGNHGIAVAHVARTLGIRATLFVPESASRVKIEAIRSLGADLRLHGTSYDEAQSACLDHVARAGALHVHPFDDEATIAGQGTIGKEWEAQCPGLDAVLVATGGGGLVSGIASWYAGRGVKVIAVEPMGANALHASMAAGHPVAIQVRSIAADSLGPSRVSDRVHEICASSVDRVVLVSDDAIVRAQALLWQAYGLIAEPGGTTALAALLDGAFVPAPGNRVGVLLCGRNAALDTGTFGD